MPFRRISISSPHLFACYGGRPLFLQFPLRLHDPRESGGNHGDGPRPEDRSELLRRCPQRTGQDGVHERQQDARCLGPPASLADAVALQCSLRGPASGRSTASGFQIAELGSARLGEEGSGIVARLEWSLADGARSPRYEYAWSNFRILPFRPPATSPKCTFRARIDRRLRRAFGGGRRGQVRSPAGIEPRRCRVFSAL